MDLNSHILYISKRMAAVPGISIDNFGLSAHLGKKLSPGCIACKSSKWTVIFIGKACNSKCFFCPQTHNKPPLGSSADSPGIINTSGGRHYFLQLLITIKNLAYARNLTAIGYSGGEPLLYVERIKKFAKEITSARLGIYQYIYTNGKLITEKFIKDLSKAGIQEIRFNLAATNFSKEIIDKMRAVKRNMLFLTIEVPVLKDTGVQISKNIGRFIKYGVDQINLSELAVNVNNEKYFKNEPCYYTDCLTLDEIKNERKIHMPYLRERYPVWSRKITYDIMERAAKEKWPITINDCSILNHNKRLSLNNRYI